MKDPNGEVQKNLLTEQEEGLLLAHYVQKLCHVAANLKLPKKVLSTAVTFLKRFYISVNVMEYDPQQMVLVCLYLSCKVEDSYISATELGRLAGMSGDIFLKLELILLQGIGFDLQIHSVFRAVDGCILDYTRWHESEFSTLAKRDVDRIRDETYKKVDRLLCTDAMLLFTPGQIGLALMYDTVMETSIVNAEQVSRYLSHVSRKFDSESNVVSQIESVIEDMRKLLKTWVNPDQDELIVLDRKVKLVRKELSKLRKDQ